MILKKTLRKILVCQNEMHNAVKLQSTATKLRFQVLLFFLLEYPKMLIIQLLILYGIALLNEGLYVT
ncbi:hypothetical protein JT13_11845 [Klebsiella pneumoniae]|nr:hypothetical protein KPNIH31_22300 [Klebsiella pneumoniae subsp. pneumoniae]ANE68507.1 hypothetical protein A7B01_02280 [Klebsiella pneumoniae]ANF43099.1 hypothetical protein WM86_22675 [Klebsiella pneumoniae]ANK43768.1 hypothetical protein WM91_23110 [Klebsiella pneumoniae]AOR88250.1 hypothetical protein AOG30_04320 [Klebsiella pneumoniae subsp. pneumoniae]